MTSSAASSPRRRRRPTPQFHPFIEVLDRDAAASQAAVRLVLAQPGISSQLVDNLNASIHLRALLTDIFLVDEVLKNPAPGPAQRRTLDVGPELQLCREAQRSGESFSSASPASS